MQCINVYWLLMLLFILYYAMAMYVRFFLFMLGSVGFRFQKRAPYL
jgi:hypothetical protein